MIARYAKYKESGVDWLGEIPAGWEVKPLRRLVREHSGYGFPVELQGAENGTVPFLKVSDFSSTNRMINSSNNSVSEKTIKIRNWNKVPAGSLVTAKIGEALRKNHRNLLAVDSLIDNNCIAFQPTDLNLLFCFYLHRIIDFDWFVNPGAVPSISVPKYKSLNVPVPSLPEQTAIAKFLDDKVSKIEALVGIKRRQIELLAERKQILIQNAVTQGMNPDAPMKDSGVDWIGTIPAHWEVKRLKYLLAEPLKYGANEEASENIVGDARYIRITDFGNDGKLRPNTVRTLPNEKAVDYLLKPNDILLARSGATVGKNFFFTDQIKACFAGYLIRARANEVKVSSDYLILYLRSSIFETWKDAIFSKSTIQNIGADKYAVLPVLLPPIAEQIAAIKFLNAETGKLDEAITLKQNQIEKLTEYKTTLINAAVTGKIKVAGE